MPEFNVVLQEILSILTIGAAAASAASGGNKDVAAGASIAGALIAIAQKANAAHIAVTGLPIDPSSLKPFEPIP